VNRTLKSAGVAFAPDAYQHVIKQKQEANIKFLIQQAKIRNSELKGISVQQFIKTLKDIHADEDRKALDNVEVSAYASPDGGMKLNTRVAKDREKTTKSYINKQLKKTGLESNVDTKYTAEDWDGFKELVSASNIQDKEVILRVLSMYKDPEEREHQIRNMSAAFTNLAKEVLPELRRSRIAVNYELIGRSDDEIQKQYTDDASKLSVEEILYDATLTDKETEKEEIYKKTTQVYPNDYRAYNDLATMAFEKGDYDTAKGYLQKSVAVKGDAAEPNVNLGLLALMDNDLTSAQNYLSKGTESNALNEALGNMYLKEGNYGQAVKSFGEVKSNSAALAQILSKDYMKAAETLNGVQKADAMTSYLKAIIAVRTNNNDIAVDNLREAIGKDATLSDYAAKDLEFVKLKNDAKFKVLTSK
jgi:Flp pilus assembly protein TadD